MKIISFIFLATGLVAGDLLDRSYLPPPGAKFAGGSPGAIDAPLDLPNSSEPDTYPEEPDDTERSEGIGRATDIPPGLLDYDVVTSNPNDPSNYYQNSFPTTTTSYAFTQTTTLAPINAYSGTQLPFGPSNGYNQDRTLTPIDQDPRTPVDYDGLNQQYDLNRNQIFNKPNIPGVISDISRGMESGIQGIIPQRPGYSVQGQRFPSSTQSPSEIPYGSGQEVNIPSRFPTKSSSSQVGFNMQVTQGFQQTSDRPGVPYYPAQPNISQYQDPTQFHHARPSSTNYQQDISNPGLRPYNRINEQDRNTKKTFYQPYANENQGNHPKNHYQDSSGVPYNRYPYENDYVASTRRPQNFSTSLLAGNYDSNETRTPGSFYDRRDGEKTTFVPGEVTNPQQSGTIDDGVFQDNVMPGSQGPYNAQVTTIQPGLNEFTANSVAATSSMIPVQSNINYRDFTNQKRPTLVTRPERPQAEFDRNAVILNYENIQTPDGYSYSYDTSNGIHADESGITIDGTKALGSYSYIGDDGILYSVVYSADENGFQPRGDHLPTPPPIPEAILRALEKNKKDEEAGIIDDGSYDEAKYGYKKYQGSKHRTNPSNIKNMIAGDDEVFESNMQEPKRLNKMKSSLSEPSKDSDGVDRYDEYINAMDQDDVEDTERTSSKSISKTSTPKYNSEFDYESKDNLPSKKEDNDKNKNSNTKKNYQINVLEKQTNRGDSKNKITDKVETKPIQTYNSGQKPTVMQGSSKNSTNHDDYDFLAETRDINFGQPSDKDQNKASKPITMTNRNEVLRKYEANRPIIFMPESQRKEVTSVVKNTPMETERSDYYDNKKQRPNQGRIKPNRVRVDNYKTKNGDDSSFSRTNLKDKPQINQQQSLVSYNKGIEPQTVKQNSNSSDSKSIYQTRKPLANNKYDRPTSISGFDNFENTEIPSFTDDERSARPKSRVLIKQSPIKPSIKVGNDSHDDSNEYSSKYSNRNQMDASRPNTFDSYDVTNKYLKEETSTLTQGERGYQYLPPQNKFNEDDKVNMPLRPYHQSKGKLQGINQRDQSRKPYLNGAFNRQSVGNDKAFDQLEPNQTRGQGFLTPGYEKKFKSDTNFVQDSTSSTNPKVDANGPYSSQVENGEIFNQREPTQITGQDRFKPGYEANLDKYASDDNIFDQDSTPRPRLHPNTDGPYFNHQETDIPRRLGQATSTAVMKDYSVNIDESDDPSAYPNTNRPSQSTYSVDETGRPIYEENSYSGPDNALQSNFKPGIRKSNETNTVNRIRLDSTTPAEILPSTTYRPNYTVGDRADYIPGITVDAYGRPIVENPDFPSQTDTGNAYRPMLFKTDGDRLPNPQLSLGPSSTIDQGSDDRLKRPTVGFRPGNQRFGQTTPSVFDDNQRGSTQEFIPSVADEDEAQPGIMNPTSGPYKGQLTKIKGEDFSGPKQPQRFDPETGYHY